MSQRNKPKSSLLYAGENSQNQRAKQKRCSPKFEEHQVFLAETVGFEPTEPIKVQTISSRSRYDRFDTSPCI